MLPQIYRDAHPVDPEQQKISYTTVGIVLLGLGQKNRFLCTEAEVEDARREKLGNGPNVADRREGEPEAEPHRKSNGRTTDSIHRTSELTDHSQTSRLLCIKAAATNKKK